MTKKEFNKYCRFYAQVKKTHGYIILFDEYAKSININDGKINYLHFKTYPEEDLDHFIPTLIDGNYFNVIKEYNVYHLLNDSRKYFTKGPRTTNIEWRLTTPNDFIKIHHKHIKSIQFQEGYRNWDDKGGKRDGKIYFIRFSFLQRNFWLLEVFLYLIPYSPEFIYSFKSFDVI